MKTILLVDDDLSIRDALQDILQQEGYQVFVADQGLDALNQLKKIPTPDLILLDIRMPLMSGPEFVELLKKEKRFEKLKVLFFSGADRAEQLKAGVPENVEILSKPIELDRFMKVVERNI